MEGQKYLVALSHFIRFGPQRLKFLFDYFGSWELAWNAQSSDLLRCGLRSETVERFLDFRKIISIEKLLENIERKNIKLLFFEDALYPPLLREIYDPPRLLYYRGTITEKTFSSPLAVVGTRKPTSYGKRVVEELLKELARDCTIVSGLAIGIDCLAHDVSLEAGGQTIAFLGSGVDEIYPRTNFNLAKQIIDKGGALLSEYPPGLPPFKTNFPRRNRLIAGSSLGTLVIEAKKSSGALITSRYALEEGREVFSVPGSIFAAESEGTNDLLRAGAKLVSSASDIRESLGLALGKTRFINQQQAPMSNEEMIIFELLGSETRHVNELARLANLDITVINSRLTIMEMKGLVRHLGSMNYARERQPKQ